MELTWPMTYIVKLEKAFSDLWLPKIGEYDPSYIKERIFIGVNDGPK